LTTRDDSRLIPGCIQTYPLGYAGSFQDNILPQRTQRAPRHGVEVVSKSRRGANRATRRPTLSSRAPDLVYPGTTRSDCKCPVATHVSPLGEACETVSEFTQRTQSCYRGSDYPVWVARTPRVRVAKRQEVYLLFPYPEAALMPHPVQEGAPPVPSEPGGSGLRATPRGTIVRRGWILRHFHASLQGAQGPRYHDRSTILHRIGVPRHPLCRALIPRSLRKEVSCFLGRTFTS